MEKIARKRDGSEQEMIKIKPKLQLLEKKKVIKNRMNAITNDKSGD
jgi:hypothetical protein